MLRVVAVGLVSIVVVACSDSNARKADTSSIPNAGAGEKVNMIQLDTTSRTAPGAVPSPSTPAAQQPPLNVTGEGHRGSEPPLNSSRDPMPPLTGETSKRGGTMPVAPVLRDSASGPKMQIDSKGNVSPIKR